MKMKVEVKVADSDSRPPSPLVNFLRFGSRTTHAFVPSDRQQYLQPAELPVTKDAKSKSRSAHYHSSGKLKLP